jgi:hypothetical protein
MKTEDIKAEGFGRQVPPKRAFVSIYFAQKGLPESEAERFFSYYDNIDWKNADGNPVRNWKTLACDWIWDKKFGFKRYIN